MLFAACHVFLLHVLYCMLCARVARLLASGSSLPDAVLAVSAVPVPDETEQGATEFAAVMQEADMRKRKRPSHRWSMYSQVHVFF